MLQNAKGLYHLTRWRLRGRPVPPPHVVKRRAVMGYAKRFGVEVFVETGTFMGQMVEAMKPHFRELYSIELSRPFYERAVGLFARDPHVHLVCGDSSEALPGILARVSEPCLFWLDGHFSGDDTARGSVDYPVIEELRHIGQHRVKDHVILIDDARLFQGTPGAPAREQIVSSLKAINPAYRVEERDDIIRACVER